MMSQPTKNELRSAADLREAFDRGFASAIHQDDTVWDDFLIVCLDGIAHALPLDALMGLQPLDWITPIPGPAPELLGITGYKGAILPVYDLRALLACPTSQAPRWLVVTKVPCVALAFDAFDRHVRCPRQAMAEQSGDANGHRHIRARLTTGSSSWPVVKMSSVLDTIQNMALSCAHQQER